MQASTWEHHQLKRQSYVKPERLETCTRLSNCENLMYRTLQDPAGLSLYPTYTAAQSKLDKYSSVYTPLPPTGGTPHAIAHLPLQNDLAANNLVRRETSNHGFPRELEPTFRAFQIFVSVVFCNSFMPAFHKLTVAVLVVLQQQCVFRAWQRACPRQFANAT